MLVSDRRSSRTVVQVSAAYPLAADACRSERLQFVRDLARKAGYSQTGVSRALMLRRSASGMPFASLLYSQRRSHS
jgi:hypothetical protein